MGWIGVDFDGTLAMQCQSRGDVCTAGAPIPRMVERVKQWLAEGKDVRIFTARVGPATPEECLETLGAGHVTMDHIPKHLWDLPIPEVWEGFQRGLLEAWCLEQFGRTLPITATKDMYLEEFWDDRCVQVETDTGRSLEDHLRGIQETLDTTMAKLNGWAEMLREPL